MSTGWVCPCGVSGTGEGASLDHQVKCNIRRAPTPTNREQAEREARAKAEEIVLALAGVSLGPLTTDENREVIKQDTRTVLPLLLPVYRRLEALKGAINTTCGADAETDEQLADVLHMRMHERDEAEADRDSLRVKLAEREQTFRASENLRRAGIDRETRGAIAFNKQRERLDAALDLLSWVPKLVQHCWPQFADRIRAFLAPPPEGGKGEAGHVCTYECARNGLECVYDTPIAEPAAPSAEPVCRDCGHSMVNNSHGFDQNDGWLDETETKIIHSGRCTYCRVCNPPRPQPDPPPAAPDGETEDLLREARDIALMLPANVYAQAFLTRLYRHQEARRSEGRK